MMATLRKKYNFYFYIYSIFLVFVGTTILYRYGIRYSRSQSGIIYAFAPLQVLLW